MSGAGNGRFLGCRRDDRGRITPFHRVAAPLSYERVCQRPANFERFNEGRNIDKDEGPSDSEERPTVSSSVVNATQSVAGDYERSKEGPVRRERSPVPVLEELTDRSESNWRVAPRRGLSIQERITLPSGPSSRSGQSVRPEVPTGRLRQGEGRRVPHPTGRCDLGLVWIGRNESLEHFAQRYKLYELQACARSQVMERGVSSETLPALEVASEFDTGIQLDLPEAEEDLDSRENSERVSGGGRALS
jgi:hypothetical protein